VVGHEYKRPERELKIDTRGPNGCGQPFADAILRQKREPMEATEAQLVRVATLPNWAAVMPLRDQRSTCAGRPKFRESDRAGRAER